MIDLENNLINLTIFKKVLREIKNNKEFYLDIIDSFSENQFTSKSKLFFILEELKIINKKSEIAILGSWYGSILVPLFQPKVKNILAIDMDDRVIRTGKNRFFNDYKNVLWYTGDIFTKQFDYSNINLLINTSCEHMQPMKNWPFWNQITSGTHFAFQSNNMFDIEGHINCVNSIEEFKTQIPEKSKILYENTVHDSRGERYTVVGQII